MRDRDNAATTAATTLTRLWTAWFVVRSQRGARKFCVLRTSTSVVRPHSFLPICRYGDFLPCKKEMTEAWSCNYPPSSERLRLRGAMPLLTIYDFMCQKRGFLFIFLVLHLERIIGTIYGGQNDHLFLFPLSNIFLPVYPTGHLSA